MPIEYKIEKDKKRVFAIVSRTVSLEDIIKVITSIMRDSSFMPGFDILSDHTRIERPIETEQLKALVSHINGLATYCSSSRWAVVTKKAASYGMMRMLAAYLAIVPMELQVFYSFDDAEEWLSSPKKR
jgi:hypothetical protein